MTPGTISKRVVGDRLDWIDRMVAEIGKLPLDNRDEFFSDSRNVWAAESCLRRALEALLDLGRHVLAKGFGDGVSEYREIAHQLVKNGVLCAEDGDLLIVLAGYRNRLTHYYHDVGGDELFDVCSGELSDVEHLADALRRWLTEHAELLDESL